MDRWGCIRFPDLPLQVALSRHSGEQGPFAVVRDERPSSPLLYLNPAALKQGLRPGMRYTAALSVVPHLRVDTVPASELDGVHRNIVELLTQWSPQVEPCAFDAEVFWINASGLSALYGTPERWGARLRDQLAELGYRVDLVIGFSRRGSYVLVRSWQRSAVVATPQSEQRAVAASPVASLALSWPLCALLDKLNVHTVAELDAIPRGELSRRLPKEALTSFNALNSETLPLQPVKLAVTTARERRWDETVTDSVSLSEALWQLVTEVLEELRSRAWLIATLTFELLQEDGSQTEVLRPAQPTSNPQTWSRLLELRLSSMVLKSGVVGVRLDTVCVPSPPTATDLFEHPVRDVTQGEKALALIRARWGNETVVQAATVDDHRPEKSFLWLPVQRLTPPRPGPGTKAAVRRVFREPRSNPNAGGGVVAGPFVFQSAADERGPGSYWFARAGREVLWIRQDGLAEPQVAGVVD